MSSLPSQHTNMRTRTNTGTHLPLLISHTPSSVSLTRHLGSSFLNPIFLPKALSSWGLDQPLGTAGCLAACRHLLPAASWIPPRSQCDKQKWSRLSQASPGDRTLHDQGPLFSKPELRKGVGGICLPSHPIHPRAQFLASKLVTCAQPKGWRITDQPGQGSLWWLSCSLTSLILLVLEWPL